MATTVHIPQWGMTMTEGKIVKWLKKEGDVVKKGEPLFEVETEKIVNEIEALVGGILFQIVMPEGEIAKVGEVVALIAQEGETPARIERSEANSEAPLQAEAGESADSSEPKAAVKKSFVPATPSARRVAKELSIDIAQVTGTGREGRVTEADVKKFQKEMPKPPKITPLAKKIADREGIDVSSLEGTGTRGKITKKDLSPASQPVETASLETASGVTSIPYVGMRKGIGNNMLASLQNAAQLTCFTEVDVTEMVRFRDTIREEFKKDESVRISYNDILIFAVSRVLKHHPIINSNQVGDEILLFDSVNMGIAVAIKEGLIVPVLKNADQKGLLQIAREARELAARARDGSLNPDDVSDGTFTISNTSMIEVDGFTPILKPPETGILGVGRAIRKPAEYKGEIALRWMMVLSLTYNHCVVDGAPAHSFLAAVGKHLRNPYLLIS